MDQDEPARNLLAAAELDIVGNVLDDRNLWNTVENVPFQLRIEIRVRITSRMRDRHPLAAGLGRLCRWSEEIPFMDGEADDLDASLEVFPLACYLTERVFFVGVKGLLGERSAKLVR